ncbi:epididymal-specific lipocalin-9 [Panthera pardus]|uniref:Epididymal-specific lipocalin-9 n=1 Tax=Panthera pardus TaxID=9691 RepID=A0A9W2VZC9_PANPR|nr:epididymal-specific lipocalin-9 [Panthera pardus]
MALFLLTLGLSLVSAQELNPQAIMQKNYNMAKVSGIWYPVSMASDDIKRIEENGDLRVFIRNIESLGDGRLRFHFRTMVHGECEHVAMVCEKAERDGEYSVSHEGDNTVLLLETDYRQYITFHLRNVRNGTQTTVLALYDLRKSAESTGWVRRTSSASATKASLPPPAPAALGQECSGECLFQIQEVEMLTQA